MVTWYFIERVCFSLISAVSRSPMIRGGSCWRLIAVATISSPGSGFARPRTGSGGPHAEELETAHRGLDHPAMAPASAAAEPDHFTALGPALTP